MDTRTPQSIYFVDDEKLFRDCFSKKIEEEFRHVQVRTAKNGLEAIELIQESTPSLLITGIMMPRMDGFTLIEHLLDQNLTVPILIFSSYLTHYDVIHDRYIQFLRILDRIDLPSLGLLCRPCNMDDFLSEVRRLLHLSAIDSRNF